MTKNIVILKALAKVYQKQKKRYFACPQYDKVDSIASECKPISSTSTYEGQSVISPSLAEGVRGWINPTSASQAKSATTNDKNATAGNANAYIINKANANISVIAKETSASLAKQASFLTKTFIAREMCLANLC